MEATTKFISLLLLVFPLFTEATHGGEYSYIVVGSTSYMPYGQQTQHYIVVHLPAKTPVYW